MAKASSKQIETVYAALGLRMRMIREALGLDQAEMGKRVGMQRTSICNLEAGRQRLLLHDVSAIAKALGTSEKALMKGIWW